MRSARTLIGWTSASLLLVCIACGTPGAPQPPSLQLPRPVDDLAGERKGTRVNLAWTAPTQTTDKQNIRRSGATRVCRAMNEFPMAQCRESVAELSPAELTSQQATGGRPKVVYEDVVAPSAMGANRFATYALEVFNLRGRSAGLSNQVKIPLAPTLPPPADLRAEVTPDGVVLNWTGLSRTQLSPDVQGYDFRYRIYRRQAGKPTYALVEEVPLGSSQRSVPDRSFEWEQNYEYKVASVTLLPQASAGRSQTEVEGDDSPIVKVTVHDVFPPARPGGLQAVFSGVGQKLFIDLSWDPNIEGDLQGYQVFRREDGHAVQLNKEPVRAPSFRDEDVQSGRKYTYYVQAVDVRGNASGPSPEASETVPEKF